MTPVFERYVAIGDSSTEGLDDPDGRGHYRGWADRLAAHIARTQGSLLYANLAIRGRETRRILAEQLEPALAMKPDLVTLFTGTNDVVRKRFDAEAVGRDVRTMQQRLIAGGATVLGFTLPDLSRVMPLARPIAPRVHALNEMLRAVSWETGALLLDFATYPVAEDPRLWSADRLHANSAGHERIAAALAWKLGLPGTDESWGQALPEPKREGVFTVVGAELAWIGRYFVPWVWRHARGRSSGDGVTPKRPVLEPVNA